MASSLWAHDNLHTWSVAPFDAKARDPEQRAQMLANLGFRAYGYSWRARQIPEFGAEIVAMKSHAIELLSWAFFRLEPENPATTETLELFKRHGVQPQLWVMQLLKDLPKTVEEWAVSMQVDMPQTPGEQEQRVEHEADRIEAFVKLAAPYGCRVKLYGHNGWFGIMENQLAILENLRGRGIADVGLVYNFSHARDWLHDDTIDFPALWATIKAHVDVVNIAGTHFENGTALLPGDGDSELEMMRTIAASGWTGRVGVIAESGGDAEVTLGNCLDRLDRLAAQLEEAPA